MIRGWADPQTFGAKAFIAGGADTSCCLNRVTTTFTSPSGFSWAQPQTSPQVHSLCLFFCCVLCWVALPPIHGLLKCLSLTKARSRSHLLSNPRLAWWRRSPCLSQQLGPVGRLPGPAHFKPHFSFRCPLNIEALFQGRTMRHLGILSAHIVSGPKKALSSKWIVCFRG